MKIVRKSRVRGQVLISLIIAMAIIAIVAAGMMGQFKGGIYGNSIEKANQTACGEYTSQIVQAISMYKQDNDGKNPPSLAALGKYGVIKDMYDDPNCQYGYDPATGHVSPPVHRIGQPSTAAAPPAPAAPAPQQAGGGGVPNPQPASAPAAAPSGPPNGGATGSLPTTTVYGGGISVKVPTGGGNVDVNAGN